MIHRTIHAHTNSDTALMTEGSIVKSILFFSIPLILGNFLQQMYNTVDSIIVGNYVGSGALAAVGSSASLIFLIIAFSQGLSVGSGVIVAQYLGAGDKRGVNLAVHTALAISVLVGLLMTVGGIVFTRPLLVWMDTPESIMPEAVEYLQLYCAGMLFGTIYNMAAGIMNAAGNSKRSLIYLGVAAVTNIVLDVVLIVWFKMGVAGAAWATNISQLVSAVLAMAFLMRTSADYKVDLKHLVIRKKMASRIVAIGLPTGIQNMVISLSNVLIQSSVNVFGASAIAGFGAFLKIDGFNVLPILSLSMAITTFVGQNYGANRMDRVNKGVYITIAMGMAYTIVASALMLMYSEPIMRMFSQEKEVIACGQLAMWYFCPFYWVLSILHTLGGTMRGFGKSIPPMVILLIAMCLFRIVWLQAILPHFPSTDCIFVLYPVSWVLGAVMMVWYTKQTGLLRQKDTSAMLCQAA